MNRAALACPWRSRSLARAPTGELVQRADPAVLHLPRPCVLPQGEVTHLLPQLHEAREALARQAPLGKRGEDRAARLALVAAIAEAALRGYSVDVGEGRRQRLLVGPELELAQA